MSTGADCRIYEKTAGQWFYDLQSWPYGATEDYETEGPFTTYRQTLQHLHDHHANPGGHSHAALPGCPHDLLQTPEFFVSYETDREYAHCDRCGCDVSTRAYEDWRQLAIQALRALELEERMPHQELPEAELQAGYAERSLPGSFASCWYYQQKYAPYNKAPTGKTP